MTAAIKMRVNISGFHGQAASLFCAYDPQTDILLAAKAADAYEVTARPGFLHVTNQSGDPVVDALFDNENMQEAIQAYFDMEAMGLLQFGDLAQRFNPQSKLERDGLDASGPKYRVAPDMSCGQVAVLVACHFARAQRGMSEAMSAFDEISSLTTI
jgi:hypothetical protein